MLTMTKPKVKVYKSTVVAELGYLRARFSNGARIHRFQNLVTILMNEIGLCQDEFFPDEKADKVLNLLHRIRKMM